MLSEAIICGLNSPGGGILIIIEYYRNSVKSPPFVLWPLAERDSVEALWATRSLLGNLGIRYILARYCLLQPKVIDNAVY